MAAKQALLPDLTMLIVKFKASLVKLQFKLYRHFKGAVGLMIDFCYGMSSYHLISDGCSWLFETMDSRKLGMDLYDILGQFKSAMHASEESLEELEEHCCKFLDVLKNMRDAVCTRIADKLKESWIFDAKVLNIELTIIGNTMHSQEVESGENGDDFFNAHMGKSLKSVKTINRKFCNNIRHQANAEAADDHYSKAPLQPIGNDGEKSWVVSTHSVNCNVAVSQLTNHSLGSSITSFPHAVSDTIVLYNGDFEISQGTQLWIASIPKPRMPLDHGKQRKAKESELPSPMDTQEDNQRSDKLCQQQSPDSSSLPITTSQKTSVPETGMDLSILSPVREENRSTGRRRSLSSPAVITNDIKIHSSAQSDLNQKKSQMIFPNGHYGLSTTTAAIPASGIENEVLEQLAEISDCLSRIESKQAENLSVQTQTECCCKQMAKELHDKNKEISDLKSRLEENKTFITRLLEALAKRNN